MFSELIGIEINPLLPPLFMFVISFLTSSAGVSGAFLLLPFQMSVLGNTAPSVSATNQVYNIVAIPGGVLRYIRENRMVWPLAVIMLIGTLPGVIIGIIIRIELLPDPTDFKVFAGFVLLFLAVKTIHGVFKKNGKKSKADMNQFDGKAQQEDRKIKVISFTFSKIEYSFINETHVINPMIIAIISLIIGVIGGVYGIGGGAFMSPVLITIYGLSVYTTAGATLLTTFATSFFSVIFFEIMVGYYPELNISPNWALGSLFGIGGLAGIYLGARFQKYMPSRIIAIILSICLFFVSLKYIISIFY